MRPLRLLVIFIALLTFSNSKLFSQIDPNSFADVFAQDSLKGFDLNLAKQKAKGEGLSGKDYANAIRFYKRQFVADKYNLHAKYIPVKTNSGASWLGKYSSASVNVAPCVNEGFESGTLTGWTGSAGVNLNSQAYPSTPLVATAGQATVMNLPFTDPFVGVIPPSPFSGNKAVRINDQNTGAVVVKLSQTFPVTASNYVFEFAYWAVMQDAPNHDCFSTPYMQVRFLNNAGTLQNCPSFSIIAPGSAGGCVGIGPLTWVTVGSGINTVKTSTGWQKFSVDLGSYITSPLISNITVEVIVGDCQATGHFGYAYFDSNCNIMNLNVNGTPVSMPSPTVYPQVQCGTTATLGAPDGFSPFVWKGPAGSGITSNPSQTIVTAVPGNYTLEMSPVGICNPPSTKIISLQFVPPTTVTASPANLCATGPNTVSTLSASGASQYTWMPGGSNSSSITVSPAATTVYTLTARTGTCTGIYTVQVTVNPDPVFNVVSSNANVCPGQTATLTAFGTNNTYNWNPGALTGSMITITQTSATTYTTIGTSTAGCTSSVTTTIGILASPTVGILHLPPASTFVCSGETVNFVATGATIIWQPGGVAGPFGTFNPTVTTTYTAFGSAGTCTNSATITISVDPGPSMTLTANPTITCPGNTTTLSVVAPLAVGAFTWNPGGINASSIAVTPTIAGGYSVSARNTKGCVNTRTINPNISPIPTINITPLTPSVCLGSSVALSASGGTAYTWMPGSLTGANVNVAPLVNTIYTVTGINGAGCSGTQTVMVTVVSPPTVSASVSPATICAGACATITPSGASTYTIQGGLSVVCPTTTSTYTIIGRSAAGCNSSPITVTVNVNASPTIAATANPASICAGASSTLNATGGVSYTWSIGGNTSSVVVAPTITTTYTLTGANALGCTRQTTVTVTVAPTPTIFINPSSATICPGVATTLSATGAPNFTWLPMNSTGSTAVVAPLVNTTYTAIGSNGTCVGQRTIAVSIAPVPTISATYSPATVCAGSCATLNPTGGVTYTVTGLTNVACPLANTNYTVVGSNAFGCRSNTVVGTLSVTNGPTLNLTATPVSICPGDSSLMNATGALSYTWQPGNTFTASFYAKPLVTTTYTVTGVNASGCTSTRTITLIVNPAPLVNASASPTAICNGSSSTLIATGATSYSWMPGSLTGSQVVVSPLVNTVYTVTGSSGGCLGTRTLAVNVNPTPTINVTASPTVICAGRSATLTATGSASTYSWSTGQTQASIVVTPANTSTYSVFGISAAGCRTSTVVVTISVTPSPTIGLTANPSSICVGGTSTLTPTGGISYTLAPTPGFVVSPLVTTVYTLTGSNAAGCTSTAVATVFVNSAVSITAAATPTNICSGSPALLTASGAVNYTWQPGSLPGSNVVVTPTSSTVYTVTGSNGGCTGTNTVAVNVTPIPTLNISTTSTAVCSGNCATLTAFGATSYTWNTGVQGPTAVVCPSVPTTYTVIGSVNGCIGSTTQAIFVNPSTPFFVTAVSPSICAGGTSTLTAGVSTNSYTWQPGGLTGSVVVVSPIVSTVYTVTGANAQGCTFINTVPVFVNPSVTPFATASTTNICSGGMVNLQGGGATNYTWFGPGGPFTGQSVNVFPTASTVYTLVGTSSGCTGQTTIGIVVSPSITVGIVSTATSVCAGNCVTLTAFGAASYTWSSGIGVTGTSVVVCPLTSTTYSVFGSASNCFANASINIAVNSAPVVTVSSSANPVCSGSTVTLTAQGANTYTWSTGSTQPVIVLSPVSTTVIGLTGSTGPGCNASISFTQSVIQTPTLTITASSPSVCNGFTTALLALGAPSVTWTPGGSTSNPLIVSPSSSTIYTATAGSGGCTSQATVNVLVIPLPPVTATANPASICAGDTAILTASGANSYTWVPSLTGGPTHTVFPFTTTTYTVVGFGTGGCPNYTTVTVNVVPAPVIAIVAASGSVCLGSVATLTATGATSYTWIPSMTTGNTFTISPATPTTYSVIGSNGGCIGFATISLGTFPPANITAVASQASVCPGNSVTLTAAGGVSYTWTPQGVNSVSIVEFPGSSTTYSVNGEDANGCIDSANVFVSVTPMVGVTAVASPSNVCEGGTVTLIGSGGTTYTWLPGGQTNGTITVTPSSNTTYTLMVNHISGCTGAFTVPVNVFPTPTVSASPLNASVCAGSSITLTATGATNYTWLPSNTNASVTVETPLANTVYTVIGDNGGVCFSTFTVGVAVNPLPAHVGASSTGTVSCTNQTVNLFGASTDTNVSYSWNGPQGYSSGIQNPTVTAIWGTFTLTVTDNATGCSATATVDVPTDNTIPSVTIVPSGSITCSVKTITLNAVHTTTNPSYSWNGPGSFISIVQNPTVSVQGTYTVTVTDLSSTCFGTALVTVGVHTLVQVTATITAATCSNGVSNNDGSIVLGNFIPGDKYDISSGTSYTGSATYATAPSIPVTGTIVSNIANPTTTLAFTIRIFDAQGCEKDTTLYLVPTDCNVRTLGIAKSVMAYISPDRDGSYYVTYTVVVKNYDTAPLTDVTLTEDLTAAFPAPATFTLIPDSTKISLASTLSLNPFFDGVAQTNLLNSAGPNVLAAAPSAADTIQFTVKVRTTKFYVPYKNSIVGGAINSTNKAISDSSQVGSDPDPDDDKNPYNNNVPTEIIFTPITFFGITKTGEIQKMDNNSYDVSYTVTVHNLGNDTLRNISLVDTLFNKTIKAPTTYVMRSAPISSGIGLIANPAYDGKTDVNLVLSAGSKMPPGTSSVRFTINVIADTLSWIKNSAYGDAYAASSPSGTFMVSDTSNAGTNPDVNGNGIWNEPSDNVPTVLLIPNTHTLFIPEGFSPNGDNINDLFVIDGLSTDGNNEITIFNRWGNKVYHHGNYDNTWNGNPNVSGTFGKDKLPPGTYYYILDMKGSGIKPISGFIVLQY